MIWILVPAYNEEAALPLLLPKIGKVMDSRGVTYRIVVVNDGSTDDTAPILDKYTKKMPIDVVIHPINRGLGETERDGFEYIAARCTETDLVVRVESDDTHEPEYIFNLIAKLDEGYDVVNTSRFQPGGGQLGVDAYRATISRMANIFMKMVFRVPGVRDYSCGFRAYRASVIQDAVRIYGNNLIQLKGLGFTSTLEIIIKLRLLGCRFAEIPFVLRYDQKQGSSKMVSSITTIGYLIMALLFHWPFGGWKSQFRGLDNLYRNDPQEAVERFSYKSYKKSTVSGLNI